MAARLADVLYPDTVAGASPRGKPRALREDLGSRTRRWCPLARPSGRRGALSWGLSIPSAESAAGGGNRWVLAVSWAGDLPCGCSPTLHTSPSADWHVCRSWCGGSWAVPILVGAGKRSSGGILNPPVVDASRWAQPPSRVALCRPLPAGVPDPLPQGGGQGCSSRRRKRRLCGTESVACNPWVRLITPPPVIKVPPFKGLIGGLRGFKKVKGFFP